MAFQYQLSTDEQIWVMIRVKQGLMTMEEALEYVRKQHEAAGLPPVVAPCHMYTTPRSPPTSPRPTRANSHNPSNQERFSNRARGRSLLKHFSRQRSPGSPGREFEEYDCQNHPMRPKSIGTPYSMDREWDKTDELLDLMLAQGKISCDDHKELLQKFATVKNYKNGDAQRMILGNLVKTGRISIDDAVHYSRLLGIVASAETEARTIAEVNNAFNDKRVYNFGVYKYYRHRSCQRRILQIDFQSCQICNIQKGNLNRIFAFAQVTDYESEEGLRFFIYFKGHQEYELEADSQEEKQKICRLLNLILENNKSSAEGRVLTQADFRGTLMRCQQVVKEGFLEKKNHNLYTTYTRRWIRIREGELSYYKPDEDNQQALNILQLSDDVTLVKKLNYSGFSITTRKKVYLFRVIPSGNATQASIEKERDEWFRAIRFACGDRRDSVAKFGLDETFSKNVSASSDNKHKRESIYQAFRLFQEELERFSSVICSIDNKGDASKALHHLQQKAKVIETLCSQMRPSSDTSAISTSMDTETSSHVDTQSSGILESSDHSCDDQLPPLLKSDRHSLIIGNSWALHNNQSSNPSTNGLSNGHSLIVDPPGCDIDNQNGSEEVLPVTHMTNGLPQRTSIIMNCNKASAPRNLSTVFEPFIPPPPAPPPPPEMVAPVTRKFEVTSKVKMRPFHWNKVSALMIKKSIWQNARDLTRKIDTDFLQQMYSEKHEKETSSETTEKADTSKKKLKSFLDPKVAQNLGIFLAGFKMDAEELKFRLAILSEDDGGLSAEQINILRRYHPTAEDIETYKKFKDRQAELENTDQFMLQLCEIPYLKTRLNVLMVVNEFPVQYDDIAPTVDRVHDACKVLCTSEKFVCVLEHVLAVCNFINSGSAQGVAMGFRLTTLPKLADCRGRDRACTLLKYVVQQIQKNCPELLEFIDELMPITLLADVSIKALEAEVEVMKKDLNNIKKNTAMLLKDETPPDRDIAFCDDVAAFVEQYEVKLTQLQKKSEVMKKLYEQMLERFAEPPGVDSSDTFTAISDFVKAFKRETDLILAAAGLGRRKSKSKIQQSYLKKENSSQFEKVEQKFISDTDHVVNTGSVDDTSPSHVAALRKAFSAEENRAYSRHGREILKAFQGKKHDKRQALNPTKEGYLDKLSNTKSPLTSSWNRRFFELTTKGHLYYSKRKNEKNVESIYLRGVPVALEDDKTLVLQTEERCYKLRAHSHKEAQEWLECLLFYTHKPANIPKRSPTPKSFEGQ
ncbi:uncharacterized protein LOC117289591 isoform X2 [Asterias rubens]|uniref:uncharacterized protein LOC117289591 isoform X2 n=1 Tax=Asterias rubens TaxID=7604 RepID=UPI0014551918|nr:uncharacterized protein LOC117289591 isoform X2 [Asterias rubens]